MKSGLMILLLIAIGIGIESYYSLDKKNKQLERRISELSRPKVSLEVQRQCSQQAKLAFDSDHLDRDAGDSSSYSNHYNPYLGKCFVLIKHSAGSHPSLDIFLTDAYEGREIAS